MNPNTRKQIDNLLARAASSCFMFTTMKVYGIVVSLRTGHWGLALFVFALLCVSVAMWWRVLLHIGALYQGCRGHNEQQR